MMANAIDAAEPEPANYDEAKVPAYTLPDPLVMADGRPVTNAAMWHDERRSELLQFFRTQVYGKSPPKPAKLRFEPIESDSHALGGLATRKQVAVVIGPAERAVRVNVLMYVPNNAPGPVPVFLGLNFGGNQTIHADPAIVMTTAWVRSTKKDDATVVDHRATEASRGSAASRWPAELIVRRGYALAMAYYGEIDPDFDDGFTNGVHALYPDGPRGDDAWGSIAAWAWGLSRIADYLETDRDIDSRRIAVIGHSRLGKTSLWAGATDPRFALVVSNDSGCGGAALSKRRFGESVAIINKSFPHWFCKNFRQYDDHEERLPVDQHELIALIAPRPVHVASAEEDRWADPRGEFLACKFASPVYRLLETDGLAAEEMPSLLQPVVSTVGYHIRPGKHDVTDYDWQQYLTFADEHLKESR